MAELNLLMLDGINHLQPFLIFRAFYKNSLMTISNIGKKEKYRLEEHAHEEMPQDICIGVNPTIL